MASLVEELVNVLDAEKKIYTTLVGYEERKKDVLIAADVTALEEITTSFAIWLFLKPTN